MNLKLAPLMAAAATAGMLLSGCGSSGNGSNGIMPISTTNPLSTGKLAFAVGTANFAGVGTGLNVVSSYRNGTGVSNSLVNTPTITGPFTFTTGVTVAGAAGNGADAFSTIPGGPALGALDAAGTITGTPQTVHLGTTPSAANTSSFGQSGGVFTDGLAPGNYTTNGVPYSYRPYTADVWGVGGGSASGSTDADNFSPWGGPPSFDPDKNGMGLRDGLNTLGAHAPLGIPEGFTAFLDGLVPATGTYTLSLSVSTGHSGSSATFGTVTQSATLGTTALLPTITAPTLTLDGSGGGSVTLPAADFAGGITEVYVQVTDLGPGGAGGANCQGVRGTSFAPVYYTMVETAAGTYTLPDTDGPNLSTSGGPSSLQPSETICTGTANTAAVGTATAGDTYSVQVVGLDYDMYGVTYPESKTQAPTFAGSNGQSDITVSAPVTGVSP